jgi:hypothetical protein
MMFLGYYGNKGIRQIEFGEPRFGFLPNPWINRPLQEQREGFEKALGALKAKKLIMQWKWAGNRLAFKLTALGTKVAEAGGGTKYPPMREDFSTTMAELIYKVGPIMRELNRERLTTDRLERTQLSEEDRQVIAKAYHLEATAKKVETSRAPMSGDVETLVNQLRQSTDASEKRKIRAKLRKLGHKGGAK